MSQLTYPKNQPDFDSEAYKGSFQQLFAHNVGRPVKIDCLIGSNNVVSYRGVLDNVGGNYVVIKQLPNDVFVVVDVYSVKAASFPDERMR